MTFPNILTILFVGLKLTNYINWSWWWVISPIIISVLISAIIKTVMKRIKL